MDKSDNEFDCSFLCKIKKCDLFAYENDTCYFGKASHTSGVVETELVDATIYITNGKFYTVCMPLIAALD